MKILLNANVSIDIPSEEILSRIIRENTFDNPLFISNQKAGRRNWQTPKSIETFKLSGETLILPRGYLKQLIDICQEHEINFAIDDQRCATNSVIFPEMGVTFRPYQERAIEAALKKDQGIIVAPTGSGKTMIALEIIRQRQQKTLIIVHSKDLASQWKENIKERFGIETGFLGDGEWTEGESITIGMIQTLAKREELVKKLDVGIVFADEGHHCPSKSYFEVIGWLGAKYRYALSATPNRRDGLEKVIYRAVGNPIIEISKKEVEELRATVPAIVKSIRTGFNPGLIESWHEYLTALSIDQNRNLLIIDIASNASGSVLILCDRVSHAQQISEMMDRRNIKNTLVHGQLSGTERETAMGSLNSSRISIGTSGLLGEGLDVSSWTVLIMASPISSEIKLIQSIGRVVRSFHGKESATVFDLKDECALSGSSFNHRLKIYEKHNIRIDLGYKNNFQNNTDDSWRSLKPSEKQINFIRSTGCNIDLDNMTRGDVADLISSGKAKKAG